MENGSALKEKSLAFSKRIVRLYQHLASEYNEYVLSKQILRSGTSIGANIAEARCAISKSDFQAKCYIAFKECAETLYWLELLYSCHYLSREGYVSLRNDCEELYKMLSATTKTLKEQKAERN